MFCLFLHVSGWKITYLSFEEDPEPFGRVRDENIKAMCKEMGVKTVTEKSHTLYDLDRFVFQIIFEMYLTLIGMRQGTFTSLVFLGLDFVS